MLKLEIHMKFTSLNSFNSQEILTIDSIDYNYFNINNVASHLNISLKKMPITIRILLENLVRFEDNKIIKAKDIKALANWHKKNSTNKEIFFHPSRILMQDFTGVPAIVDLATMRDAVSIRGHDATKINPLIPVDLVIDHSVQVDYYGTQSSLDDNVAKELSRNKERYEFLKWGQKVFNNFRVVPPGKGICHQINLEYLSQVVYSSRIDNKNFLYPDTLVGTDSHTTMVNGLAVLGWGVGGIEAEAAMLGQPLSMTIPEVIGFKLAGQLSEGVTATDMVLTITEILRKKNVVNKFVEFYGEGLDHLSISDRATISNMSPEFGATCGFFGVDEKTLSYLKLSGRSDHQIRLVEKYAKIQGLWIDHSDEIIFDDIVVLDLSTIQSTMAGPKRPQDKVTLNLLGKNFQKELPNLNKNPGNTGKAFAVESTDYELKNGNIVISAITSCTNTSNPYVMMGAGLLAKKAVEKGLKTKAWVKTSLAPGSQVVTEYLVKSGLQFYLDKLGFNLVGYGCTTCIGNSGPLNKEVERVILENNLVVAAVLSGNRNFEGRIHPLVRANYLASPLLCVAFALAGTVNIDISAEPIGIDNDGRSVYLKDIWPTNSEISQYVEQYLSCDMFTTKYNDIFTGDSFWQSLKSSDQITYEWDKQSTYIRRPPYFNNMNINSSLKDIFNAKILAVFGDSVTTDHISPAGNISQSSPAAKYLKSHSIDVKDFNSYGARRGNHEVMMRGTFANTRIKNELNFEVEGGYTRYEGQGDLVSIYDAAMFYQSQNTSTIIIAGKEYGSGSSRDWAAKGPALQGVKVVIAESFERIHRSNLVGMGIIPLIFLKGMNRTNLNLKGDETFDIIGLKNMAPRKIVECIMYRKDNSIFKFNLESRIDTDMEVDYINSGGILQYVINTIIT